MRTIGLINLSGGIGEALALNACIVSLSHIYNLEYFIVRKYDWLKFNEKRACNDTSEWVDLFKDQDRLCSIDLYDESFTSEAIGNKYINIVKLNNSPSFEGLNVDTSKINRFVGTNQDVNSWIQYKDIIEDSLNLQRFNFDDDITVIHVRRTDWTTSGNYFIDLCETDYYKNAINQAGNSKILFVSDDINWTREWFESFKHDTICSSVTYYDGSPIEAFNIMLNAKSLIISPSTYARWAAYLNKNEVYFPELFYREKGHLDLKENIDSTQYFIDSEKWHRVNFFV